MAIGEVFVGALLQVLFQLLASGAIDQVLKYVTGMRIDPKTIKNFEKSLRRIAALLNDAQQRRIESESFKLWVQDLQDLAFDLEDFLDELATDAQLQLLHQRDDDEDGSIARNITCLRSAKNKVKNIIACGSRAVKHIHYSCGEIPSSKIEELNNRLQEILIQAGDNVGLVANMSTLQANEAIHQGSTQVTMNRAWRETTSVVSEPVVYGREDIKHDVIQKLLEDDPSHDNYVVFSLVGKGGIGKTTIAQSLYTHYDQKDKDHFDFKAWVCISEVFDVTRVTTEIINSSSQKANLSFSSLNQAQNALIKEIQQRRFLIVLDDIWTEHYNDWTQLITPFQHGKRGSRVIVTTRNENIARRANPTNLINVEGLSNDDCWRLFKRHVHEGNESELDEMRDDIVNKCKGLPLAAKALGGLFCSTTEKRQRLNILKSNVWTEEGDVLPVLRLSYYHLPSNLKPIFAYCSVLPKDYEFKEMEMILLWMAQGLLVEEKGERIEDTGHLCFQGLVSRSLFERSPSDYKKCYVMHDLVHDLAQWAAGDICCCVMDMKDLQREVKRIRHLFITSSGIDDTLSIIQPVAGKLRSLICPAEKHIDGLTVEFPDFITRYRCVRTLVLASGSVYRLPECIGDLKHLRFLDLKFSKIKVFPDSIRKLCNLEVLFLEDCYDLREVSSIKYLVKLRHLRFHQRLWESMPCGIIRKLTNLQSLGTFFIRVDHDNNESMIKELGSLHKLHEELCLEGLENVRKAEDAREAKLHEKPGLTRMRLSWGVTRIELLDENTQRDVLEQLKPHSGIEVCELKGYVGLRLPSWLGDPSFKNMVAIKLEYCSKCECLPPLGQLLSLKKLDIKYMDEIKEVGHSVLGGPCLEELTIFSCESLISITEIPVELKHLYIERCTELQKVEIKKDAKNLANYDNQNKVIINLKICDSLVAIGQIPLTVQKIYIANCKNLKYLLFAGDKAIESKDEEEESSGETIQESRIKQVQNDPQIVLSHLGSVLIHECENFKSLPANLVLPSVRTISFSKNERQDAIPEQIKTFTTLEKLHVSKCPNIHCFPKGGLPENCREIELSKLKIEEPPIGEWGLHLLPHLQRLKIAGLGSTTDAVECIPGPYLHLPSSLCFLSIKGFKNLKSLNCSSFPNLTEIRINDCPKLENLGDYNFLRSNLTYSNIINCPRIEPGFFFNMKYFEDEVQNGNWEEVERYLSGFTKLDDNRYSMEIFVRIRIQKYLEALDEHDRCKAADILEKDLKIFPKKFMTEEKFKKITQLLTLDNIREHELLFDYEDTKSERTNMLDELKDLIEDNPLLCNKLQLTKPNYLRYDTELE